MTNTNTYLTGRNESHTYLRRFFAETRKVDHAEEFVADGAGEVICAVLTYGYIVEAILEAPASEQVSIARMIRRIDYADGDVCRYLRHLGTCLVRQAAA